MHVCARATVRCSTAVVFSASFWHTHMNTHAHTHTHTYTHTHTVPVTVFGIKAVLGGISLTRTSVDMPDLPPAKNLPWRSLADLHLKHVLQTQMSVKLIRVANQTCNLTANVLNSIRKRPGMCVCACLCQCVCVGALKHEGFCAKENYEIRILLHKRPGHSVRLYLLDSQRIVLYSECKVGLSIPTLSSQVRRYL